jgi:outer membrane protein insertion porin family
LRADLQFIQPLGSTSFDQLPFGEKLFLGGETTVRGYRPYAIGPLFPGTNDPTGGLSSSLFSFEYQHKLFEKFYGFAFFDSGCISQKAFTISTLRSTYGIGVRIEVMPNTPVVLGYGWPVNPSDHSAIKNFFISFGGRF